MKLGREPRNIIAQGVVMVGLHTQPVVRGLWASALVAVERQCAFATDLKRTITCKLDFDQVCLKSNP